MFERVNHEILTVEEIRTATQTATVKKHHTMATHLQITSPVVAAVGVDYVLTIAQVAWDNGEAVTDETHDVTVLFEGTEAAQQTTVDGQATVTIQFADPGAYLIEARSAYARGASLEVTVS